MDITEYDSKLKYISEKLPIGELLTQLAEEAGELVQAALKYRRTIVPNASPTTKTETEAIDNLAEEIIDVALCVKTMMLYGVLSEDAFDALAEYKTNRWYERTKRQ